jgi:serine/threonine-protein kinase
MGDVWLADHLGLKTRVAVKFVSERVGPGDTEAMERFAREASLAAQIKSSHVVQKFDHGVMEDGTPYIVMEYLEGEGLGELLAREKKLPLSKVGTILWQTGKALNSAHKLGIVHRDIKPDNIFLSTRDDELHVKVFDFGVAKATSLPPVSARAPAAPSASLGLTNDGVMIGTPEYMSPEQVMSSRAVDHFADLWALAVVAYVSLTGKLPFVGDDVGELCVRLLEGEYAAPSSIEPSLPPLLDDWFKRAFAKNRAERYQSAREMAQAFMSVPGASDDDLLAGGYEVLPVSSPGIPFAGQAFPSQPEIHFGGRGLRAATFGGAAADADLELMRPRRRASLIAAVMTVCVLVIGGIAAILMSAGTSEEPQPAQAAPTIAEPPAKHEAAHDVEEAEVRAEGSSAAAGSASGASPGAPLPRPLGKPWPVPPQPPPAPRAKDPGF